MNVCLVLPTNSGNRQGLAGMVVLLQLAQSSQCHSTNCLALQAKPTLVKTQQSKQRHYANLDFSPSLFG
jgi:hypothetical protein